MPAATTGGGSELENRYGRERWRSSSITALGPVVNPPSAPPRDLPNVPVKMSILSITPDTSAEPRPVLPRKPVAWHSSMCTNASYFSAKAVIAAKGAMEPSIENTPSLVISLIRQPAASRRLQLRFQVGHVAVAVAEALGLAQAHAVDDRGVVQGIGDDRVVFAQQGFEQTAVGIEAGGVKDGVFGAEVSGDFRFQLSCADPGCRR